MKHGLDLFNSLPGNFLPEGGDVLLYPHFFSEDANRYLLELQEGIAWREEEIVMFGKRMKVPRLTAWYGDKGASYSYSGIKLEPLPWTPILVDIKARIEGRTSTQYNSVLLNFYRDGTDSMGWHSDDEPELGKNPSIASVSFGEVRKFHFRHKLKKIDTVKLELGHGSLLLMKGATQHHWQHQLPKSKRVMGPRINLTFREVK